MPAACDRESSAFSEQKAGAGDREGCRSAAQEISTDEQARRRAMIDAMLALRDSGKIKPVTLEEILAWRHEGHRY
jgi:hypothetical protein